MDTFMVWGRGFGGFQNACVVKLECGRVEHCLTLPGGVIWVDWVCEPLPRIQYLMVAWTNDEQVKCAAHYLMVLIKHVLFGLSVFYRVLIVGDEHFKIDMIQLRWWVVTHLIVSDRANGRAFKTAMLVGGRSILEFYVLICIVLWFLVCFTLSSLFFTGRCFLFL